jgi:hypothetical protein
MARLRWPGLKRTNYAVCVENGMRMRPVLIVQEDDGVSDRVGTRLVNGSDCEDEAVPERAEHEVDKGGGAGAGQFASLHRLVEDRDERIAMVGEDWSRTVWAKVALAAAPAANVRTS